MPLQKLDQSVRELSEEVRRLRADVAARPSRTEVAKARRMAVVRVGVAALWLVIFAIQLTDQHVEKCSSGARAEAIISQLRDGKIHTLDEFLRIATDDRPTYCEVTFPLHSHDLTDWPSPANRWGLLGLGVIALASIAMVWPRRWEHPPSFGRRWDDESMDPNPEGSDTAS